MRCGCMFCWWNMFVVTWFEGDVSPAEDVTRGDGEQSEVLTVLDLTLAERQGHCIQLVPYAVAWGSPRTPSNKHPEILLQFYHLPYFWSATLFLKISNQTQLGKLEWKKNWASLSRLHITTVVFLIPGVPQDYFFLWLLQQHYLIWRKL